TLIRGSIPRYHRRYQEVFPQAGSSPMTEKCLLKTRSTGRTSRTARYAGGLGAINTLADVVNSFGLIAVAIRDLDAAPWLRGDLCSNERRNFGGAFAVMA